MRVHGELRHTVLAHECLEVGPYGVRALTQHAGLLVEHLVEDLHTLVGGPHLVCVGIHQGPAHIGVVPVGSDGIDLPADVLNRLLDEREERLEGGEDRVGGARQGRLCRPLGPGRRHGKRVPARGSGLLLLVQAHVFEQSQRDP